MSMIVDPPAKDWTAADVLERFGPIPLWRIVRDPAPGTATEEDVVRLDDHEDRLCELVDGVLVAKTVGFPPMVDPPATDWTAEDALNRFGPIPIWRIVQDPPPGTAKEEDVVRLLDHEDRLCELVDGVLLKKTVGFYESFLALELAVILRGYVRDHKLGIVLGADGLMRIAPGMIRIPDTSFISWDRLPNRQVPRTPVPDLAPDLAVEVISKGNTRKEMEEKLQDYFREGVRAVWYVYPDKRVVHVYDSAESFVELNESQTLVGGDVVPGFRLELREYFAEPPCGESTSQ